MEAKKTWEDWLYPKKRVELKLESVLKETGKEGVVLVVIRGGEYSAVEAGLLGFLRKKMGNGLFVSANKTLSALFETAGSMKDEKGVVFVDLVSEAAGTEKIVAPNVHYLESPQNLLELTVLVDRILGKMPSPKFLVLDSLSTLLLYNKAETVEKFVHALAGKLRGMKALGILLMVSLRENEDSLHLLTQFCDVTIEINEGQTKAI